MSIPLHFILLSIAASITSILLLFALVGALRSRPSDDPSNDPRCGACGCILAHPADGICPTCRSPIAAVGMVLPFSHKRTSGWTGRQAFFKVTALPLALWTLAITGLAFSGTYAIDQWLLPYTWQTTSSLEARPRSSACRSIVISTLEEYQASGRAQFDFPRAAKTTRVEFKTDERSHILNIDLLAPSYRFTDSAGKRITGDRVPTKTDLLNFMRETGLPTDAGATQDAAILATMLAKLAPAENSIASSREVRGSSNLTTLTLNGGQWKTTIPLQTLAMWISPTLWLIGFIFIIYLQRNRRAALVSDLLAPPITTLPPQPGDGDAIGGWDITLHEDAIQTQRPPLQPPRAA